MPPGWLSPAHLQQVESILAPRAFLQVAKGPGHQEAKLPGARLPPLTLPQHAAQQLEAVLRPGSSRGEAGKMRGKRLSRRAGMAKKAEVFTQECLTWLAMPPLPIRAAGGPVGLACLGDGVRSLGAALEQLSHRLAGICRRGGGGGVRAQFADISYSCHVMPWCRSISARQALAASQQLGLGRAASLTGSGLLQARQLALHELPQRLQGSGDGRRVARAQRPHQQRQ